MDSNLKKSVKLFLIFFTAGYVIFNWTDVSWIFNYKAVGGLVYDFFNPYQDKDYFLPTPTIPDTAIKNISDNEPKKLNIKPEVSDKKNIIEIPAIGLKTEIVFPQTTDINVLNEFLDSGVIYYPNSVSPDQVGQIVMLGHSAPPGWPKIKHDWVFSELDQLQINDNIIFNLNYQKYTYKVIDKKIIARGQEIPQNSLTAKTNVIVLVSCYPPGKDYQRIVVFGEIVKS